MLSVGKISLTFHNYEVLDQNTSVYNKTFNTFRKHATMCHNGATLAGANLMTVFAFAYFTAFISFFFFIKKKLLVAF